MNVQYSTSHPKLTTYVEGLISKDSQEFGLDQKETDQIKKCISRYTAPKSFSQTFSWIIFRIWNAVKAVFGNSEWQKTTKIVEGGIHKRMISRIDSQITNLSDDDKKKICNLSEFRKVERLQGKGFLVISLVANEKKVSSSQETYDAMSEDQKKLMPQTQEASQKMADKVNSMWSCQP